MAEWTRHDLTEAKRQIDSLLSKLAKVEPKLKPGSSQHSLLKNRVRALEIANQLIEQEMSMTDQYLDGPP